MAELVFTSAVKEEKTGRIETTFKLDGVEYTAVKPSQHQFVRLAASSARRYRDVDRAAAVLEFLDAAISPESSDAIAARLDDPDDQLDFTDILPIMEELVKLWGDDPDGKPGGKPPRKR